MQSTVVLTGHSMTFEEFDHVVSGHCRVELSEPAKAGVAKARERIEQILTQGEVVYGVNTGFGKLSDVTIQPEDVRGLQENLIRSHAVGVGHPFPVDVVRGMLVLRANALAGGHSGISVETLQLLLDMLNAGVHPVIPSKGSLGASGDLAPLAHMALVLIGEGKAEVDGKVLPGDEALRSVGLQPVRLRAKEGLALINGTQAMTSVGVLAWLEAARVGQAADAAACLTLEALRGIRSAFDPDLMALRPHPAMLSVAERLNLDLKGSKRISDQGDLRVQDAYSLRCIPQVHGASWSALDYVQNQLNIELNAVTDNPLILPDGRVLSGGHFHGQPVALALDFLKVAVAEWGNISERRTERMVNPQLGGFTPFLAHHPGIESGLMIVQYVAASLVSENKVLAHPATVDSIPSSANQEDHVSMGTIAARQVREMVHNVSHVIAIELICASQALHLEQADADVSPVSRRRLETVRAYCPPLTGDASISDAIEALAAHIRRQGLDG